MEFEHKALGQMETAELTQGQMEKFGSAVVNKESESLPVYYGEVVRAAIKAGILVMPEMKVEDVIEQKPAFVKWLATNILQAVGEANRIDPLP